MIEVQGLTRFYADRPAIQDLSFSVPRGQELGFLNQRKLVADDAPDNLARSLTGAGGAVIEMVVQGAGFGLRELQARTLNLEEVFLHLTTEETA